MPPPQLPPVRACLFDMDGLLIDSEDLYTICTNTILHEYGKPDIPWNIKAQLQGRPGPAAGEIFRAWAQLPISHEEFMVKQTALQRKWFPSTKALPGVEVLLGKLGKARGRGGERLEVALATSSHRGNFELKTAHLQELFKPFKEENRVLGDDPRIAKGRGKPAPDIYLLALETLNKPRREQGKDEIRPEECLVFEDSVPGVESGRRAGMQVVWSPHPGLLQEFKGREEEVLAGLCGEHDEVEERKEALGVLDVDGKGKKKGAPGELKDGWAVFLETLQGFPYQRFGIEA